MQLCFAFFASFAVKTVCALLGHEVTVISGADGVVGEQIREGVKFINIDRFGIVRATHSRGRLSLARQAVFLPVLISMQTEKYDIYHGHLYASGIAANILARRHNGIAVNTIHGSYYPAWNQLADPLTAAFYKMGERALAPYLARISDLQIHACHYFAEQVIKWGVNPDKIRVNANFLLSEMVLKELISFILLENWKKINMFVNTFHGNQFFDCIGIVVHGGWWGYDERRDFNNKIIINRLLKSQLLFAPISLCFAFWYEKILTTNSY